jgi:hypothetical protein
MMKIATTSEKIDAQGGPVLVGLLCQGHTQFSDIELFRGEESQIMQHGLEINAIASESRFRQLFDKIAKKLLRWIPFSMKNRDRNSKKRDGKTNAKL